MNTYLESFQEVLKLRYSVASEATAPSEWIAANTQLRGKNYSFKDHEYQIAIADDKHRIVTAEKPAQIGFTEVFLRWLICFLVQHQGSQAIMTQPTDKDMSNFAKSRVDTVFDECPVIKKLGTGGIDSTQLKRIGQSFMNLRGTFGTRAAISVPSDANVYDEVNFSNPRVLSQYKSRLQHSEYKYERAISTPTLPNYGVSDMYNRSDKKRLFLKCSHCGEQQTLDWPQSIFFRTKSGKAFPYDKDVIEQYVDKPWNFVPFIGCKKCNREVDRGWKYREWVAEFPERAYDLNEGISGYKLSQLDVVFVAASEIVKASEKRLDGYRKYEDFVNFVLGSAYAGGEGVKITDSTKSVATLLLERVTQATGTYIGIDLGSICHLVVIKDFWFPNSVAPVPVLIASHRIDKERLETDLPAYMEVYGALYTVSDAQPYTTTVEKVAASKEGRMSCCYFGGKRAYSLSNENITVTANRTMALDAVTDDLPLARIMVGSGVEHEDLLWLHFKNLVKVKAEDDDGTEYYEYVKVGDDHFGYALAYALLARRIFIEVKPGGHTGLAPVDIVGARTNI